MRKAEFGDAETLRSLKELSELTSKGIADLRDYTRDIKTSDTATDTLLVPAVKRFAAKFSDATGIRVDVDADSTISVNDRLAGEVFQMISEGLSNVRRHSQAKSVSCIDTTR